MKSLLLFIICTLALFANGLQYEHNLDKAIEEADKQHKEVMMMYSAVWCPECNYMKDVVFKDEEVLKYIQKHYVVLALDVQKDTLPKGFNYMAQFALSVDTINPPSTHSQYPLGC